MLLFFIILYHYNSLFIIYLSTASTPFLEDPPTSSAISHRPHPLQSSLHRPRPNAIPCSSEGRSSICFSEGLFWRQPTPTHCLSASSSSIDCDGSYHRHFFGGGVRAYGCHMSHIGFSSFFFRSFRRHAFFLNKSSIGKAPLVHADNLGFGWLGIRPLCLTVGQATPPTYKILPSSASTLVGRVCLWLSHVCSFMCVYGGHVSHVGFASFFHVTRRFWISPPLCLAQKPRGCPGRSQPECRRNEYLAPTSCGPRRTSYMFRRGSDKSDKEGVFLLTS